MRISVVIEPIAGDGFRARGELFDLTAEGKTRDEALEKLKGQLQARLRNGAEIVPVELAAGDNPWVKFAGMFKDNPMFDEVLEIMAENRRKDDADPDGP